MAGEGGVGRKKANTVIHFEDDFEMEEDWIIGSEGKGGKLNPRKSQGNRC